MNTCIYKDIARVSIQGLLILTEILRKKKKTLHLDSVIYFLSTIDSEITSAQFTGWKC